MVPAAQEQPWDQVGGADTRRWSTHRSLEPRRPLPLAAQAEPNNGGWVVRLPLRAEQVAVDRELYVAERVTVHRNQVAHTVKVHDTVAREELRVDVVGDLERRESGDAIEIGSHD